MGDIRLRVISLGAGVQSTTMALMAAHGEVGPMPDAAIFADTGAEPGGVYEHLKWITGGNVLPFPVYVVSAGNLRDEILGAMAGSKHRMDARPPFYTLSGGMLRRQCTQDYKLLPIQKKVRELLGLKRGARGPKRPVVEQWIGISTDEAMRVKPSRYSYMVHRWPLIEMRASVIATRRRRRVPAPSAPITATLSGAHYATVTLPVSRRRSRLTKRSDLGWPGPGGRRTSDGLSTPIAFRCQRLTSRRSRITASLISSTTSARECAVSNWFTKVST